MKSIGMLIISLALTGTLAASPQRGGQRGNARIANMDTDGDGKISQSEWKGPAQAFQRLDANHDGYITRDEMAAARGQGQDRSGQRNARNMDTNNDGRISSDEWKGSQEVF